MKRSIATILCLISSFYFGVAFVGGFNPINLSIAIAFFLLSVAYWVRGCDD
jgi:hypothetical protein